MMMRLVGLGLGSIGGIGTRIRNDTLAAHRRMIHFFKHRGSRMNCSKSSLVQCRQPLWDDSAVVVDRISFWVRIELADRRCKHERNRYWVFGTFRVCLCRLYRVSVQHQTKPGLSCSPIQTDRASLMRTGSEHKANSSSQLIPTKYTEH
jgi:hypothetical protein